MRLGSAAADELARCVSEGGVALIPTDTVYGLACDPHNSAAVRRLHRLKGREAGRPAAILFWTSADALAALRPLTPRLRSAMALLLPGPITLLLANPARLWPLASGPESTTLGVRVPRLGASHAALRRVGEPVLQSSANPTGGPDPRRIGDVADSIRAGVDLELDGGDLPGVASTIVDLSEIEAGKHTVLREGAVGAAAIALALAPLNTR